MRLASQQPDRPATVGRPHARRLDAGAIATRVEPVASTADRAAVGLGDAVFDVAAPVAVYYGSRSAGAGIYFALLAGALMPAMSTTVRLVRARTIDRLAVFVMTTMLIGVAVALVAGSPRFLLAKEAWVTGVAGAWFLTTARGNRPLAFLFARPLLEGRRAFTSESWDSLWTRLPRFRRVWRVSSVIWGVGLILDAAIRVTIAYTLPIDLVPAVAGAIYPATFVVLQVIDQINYRHLRLWRMLSSSGDASQPKR